MTSSAGEKSWATFLANSVADLFTAERIFGSLEDVEVDFVSVRVSALGEFCCVKVNPSSEPVTSELAFVLTGKDDRNFGNSGSFASLDDLATEATSGVKSFLELTFALEESDEGNFVGFASPDNLPTEETSGIKSFDELSSFSVENTEVNFVSVGNADSNWLSRAGNESSGPLYDFVEANIVGTLSSSDAGTDDFAGNGVTAANVIGSLLFFENEGIDSLKLGTFQLLARYAVSLRIDFENGFSRPVKSFVF